MHKILCTTVIVDFLHLLAAKNAWTFAQNYLQFRKILYTVLVDPKIPKMYNSTMMKRKLDFYLEWLATAITIVGAVCAALDIYPWSAMFLNAGAAVWLVVSIMWRKWSLIAINATLLGIYTTGLVVKLL